MTWKRLAHQSISSTGDNFSNFTFDEADILKVVVYVVKEGTDTTIVTYSIMLHKSLEAAKILKNEFELDVEVIDLQSLRPIDTETVEKFLTKITRSLEELGQSEVSSNTIGTMVMDGLKEIDPVAYVRFASVYRNFREEKDFVQFVDKLDVYKKR